MWTALKERKREREGGGNCNDRIRVQPCGMWHVTVYTTVCAVVIEPVEGRRTMAPVGLIVARSARPMKPHSSLTHYMMNQECQKQMEVESEC